MNPARDCGFYVAPLEHRRAHSGRSVHSILPIHAAHLTFSHGLSSETTSVEAWVLREQTSLPGSEPALWACFSD
jgi:hypothetical protein